VRISKVKRNVSVLLSVAAIALGVGQLAVSAELKVGVVSTNRLMAEAPQAKVAIDALRAEFAPRERELQTKGVALKAREEKLQKDEATMTEVQRSAADKELRDGYRDLQRMQSELQDDFNARRNEEMSKLNRTLLEEVQVFAKAQAYDLILADGVIYANGALDVTGQILGALQARKSAAGTPAPAKPAAPAAPAKP
jgi:outer membrane protein